MPLDVLKELFVRCNRDTFDQFVRVVEQRLHSGWIRDRSREDSITRLGDGAMICFYCDERNQRPAASVWLTDKEEGTWYISNIVPESLRQLSRAQYNSILSEFAELFAVPAGDELRLDITITNELLELSHWLDSDTERKLISFSRTANKSTGSGHPMDRERWLAFIVSAHRSAASLDAHTLQRWLVEEEGWGPDQAFDLAEEYAAGRDLLKFNDRLA